MSCFLKIKYRFLIILVDHSKVRDAKDTKQVSVLIITDSTDDFVSFFRSTDSFWGRPLKPPGVASVSVREALGGPVTSCPWGGLVILDFSFRRPLPPTEDRWKVGSGCPSFFQLMSRLGDKGSSQTRGEGGSRSTR